jgi:transposase
MTNASSSKKHESVPSEGAHRATADATESAEQAGAGHWSSERKVSAVLELLHGADPETISRKYRVTAVTLTEWRDRFLAGGESSMKSRQSDIEDEEKQLRLPPTSRTV